MPPRKGTTNRISVPKPRNKAKLSSTGPGRILAKEAKPVYGPGEAPAGFIGPTTSYTEWVWYWASARIYKDPPDPRMPPFWGGIDWGYQIPEGGGRQNPLGAVVDFIYYMPGETMGVRIQTDRFHEQAGPVQQAWDRDQRMALSQWMTIRDVYEQDFIGDGSGEAACRLLIQTLGGRERIKPGSAGTYRRVRTASI